VRQEESNMIFPKVCTKDEIEDAIDSTIERLQELLGKSNGGI
jgi:hypothetical protein